MKNNKFVEGISGRLSKMSGKYHYQTIFADWVEMMAISINNSCSLLHDEIWNKREQKYRDIANKYTKEELSEMSLLFGMLVEALENELCDYLGQIYMESNSGSKATGQFFTPYHLSTLTAKIVQTKIPEGKLYMNEPSCGGGGMIIATAQHLQECGYDYQSKMKVVAQDLDHTAVNMCYVQLSLLGIDAVVCQGDTLQHINVSNYDIEHRFYTPKAKGALL